jgi:1-phosphofructokinase
MNPALDKTAVLPRLVPGGLNRLSEVRVDAGGKGINVSKMIAVLGGDTLCTGFVGGAQGEELTRRINALGLRLSFIEVQGVTRTNLKLVDEQGGLTEINEPGVQVSEKDLDHLKQLLLATDSTTVVISGSLPRGASPDTYRVLCEALRAAGKRVIIDADGEAFARALEAKPFAVKPNRFELLQYFGLPQDTHESALPGLCRKLLDMGVSFVALSMGEAGALFLNGEKTVLARTIPLQVRSSVGAGDSMVGALAYAFERGLDFEETVRFAMGAAMGAVTTEGTNAPPIELVRDLAGQIICETIEEE